MKFRSTDNTNDTNTATVGSVLGTIIVVIIIAIIIYIIYKKFFKKKPLIQDNNTPSLKDNPKVIDNTSTYSDNVSMRYRK